MDPRELLREGKGGEAKAEAEAEAEAERGGVAGVSACAAGVSACAAGVAACAAGVVGQLGDGRAGMGAPSECAAWLVIRV